MVLELAGDAVEDAEGAEVVAVAGPERCCGVGADVRVGGDEWVEAGAVVGQGVGDGPAGAVAGLGGGAEGAVAGDLLQVDAVVGVNEERRESTGWRRSLDSCLRSPSAL